jgi:hypothetical protein
MRPCGRVMGHILDLARLAPLPLIQVLLCVLAHAIHRIHVACILLVRTRGPRGSMDALAVVSSSCACHHVRVIMCVSSDSEYVLMATPSHTPTQPLSCHLHSLGV